MQRLTSLLGVLALGLATGAHAQAGGLSPVAATQTIENDRPRWIRGTQIQLMVIREVNSRTAKAGDRVDLRVNAPVNLGNHAVIPVGAVAHAEVVAVSGTSAAGGKGQLSLRLTTVETRWGPVKLSGTKGTQGAGNTGGVVLSVIGFGLLGLLNKGGNAVFKGGDVITGYIDEGESPVSEPLEVRR